MARARKKPTSKSTVSKADKKSAVTAKKSKSSLRVRNEKAAKASVKPKRVKAVAQKAKKHTITAAKAITGEHHVIPRKENPGFFTKSRRMTPRYFADSLLELRYVSWPGFREAVRLVFAVSAFAMTVGVFIAILDFGLERLFRAVIL